MDESKLIYDIVISSNAGRKTKCTPELIALLYECLARGSTVKDACIIVGLRESTYYQWMSRGRAERERLENENAEFIEKETVYMEFMESMSKAVPLRKLSMLDAIARAGETSWQALSWILARQYPDEFSKRTIVKIETWQTEIIELIRQGTVTFEQVEAEIGQDNAERLFERSGETRP